ncbi:hypothetical protein BJX61DRAFT_545352 [Aspergillus egyptiacus]|nr:hypothetical protein BJX61DRAFT_545352 [Aspergillus egyptiacus]
MTHDSTRDTLALYYDMGADSEVPVISDTGIILISVLIGIDILALYAMAVYTCLVPRWTDNLDAFAMLRIGSALGEKVPLKVAPVPDDVSVLDEIAGWVGDLEEQGPVGSRPRRDILLDSLSWTFLGKEWGRSSG